MSGLQILLPAGQDLEVLAAGPDLPPFGDLQLDFAAALSRALTTSPASRQHPELMALGFWLRPAHLRRLVDRVLSDHAHTVLQPRGLGLHIAPGNVDTIFVYSWMLSLLCGNRSIVRLSSRPSEQTTLLLAMLQPLLEDPAWRAVARSVAFVRYAHDDSITARLSARCDLRVVWGGDATVQAVRAVPLPAHATELCFPDKFSLTLLRADAVADAEGPALAALARALANDAYTFGQQACSSPRLVLWLGDQAQTERARSRLWPPVEAAARQMAHGLGMADHLNTAVAVDLLALQADVHIAPGPALVRRVWLDNPAVHAEAHGGGGLFHEAGLATLDDLPPLLSRRVQTVSHHGFSRDELLQFCRRHTLRGIDRMVPVGQALAFGPVWDGTDLWRAFTREIDVRA